MKIIKNILLISIFFLALCDIAHSQTDNFINQYDPYIISLRKMTFYYPVDDDPITSNSPFAIFISGTIGSQDNAFVKVITADKVSFGTSKEFQEGYLQEISLLDTRGILIPPLKDMNGTNILELHVKLYTGFNEVDYPKIKKAADMGTVTVNSSLIAPFTGFYNFYNGKSDVYKPTDENWAEFQVFLAGMGARQKIDCGGVNYVAPFTSNVSNIKAGENFVPGDKIIEDKKSNAMAIINFKLINNEILVSEQDFYKKLNDKFAKYAGNSIYSGDYLGIMEDLNDFKTFGFKDKNDLYISPDAKKQLGYILDLLILAQPIKVDTAKESLYRIPMEGEQLVDYFKVNISGEKTKNNRYIFDDYIGNDMYRIKLQREFDLIRNYYNLR
jgi:hypothetical protein